MCVVVGGLEGDEKCRGERTDLPGLKKSDIGSAAGGPPRPLSSSLRPPALGCQRGWRYVFLVGSWVKGGEWAGAFSKAKLRSSQYAGKTQTGNTT